MGINNTMCNWNDGNPYFMQPVAQSLSYYLDADKFEVSAATGDDNLLYSQHFTAIETHN
jgi:hypothetical protein